MKLSERSRVPKLERHRVGMKLATSIFSFFFLGGVPCLAVSFYWSRWATSQ